MRRIGIDIGGTQLRAAVFDENMHMGEVYKTANDPSLSCRENADKLIAFIRGFNEDFAGIGIGCPGPLDTAGGRLLVVPNLYGWDHFCIRDYFAEKTGQHTKLNNDGNVAALAEALMGAGKGAESVVYIGISTGIGGGFIYQGKIYSGAHSNAAEFWNMVVNEDPACHKNALCGSLNEQCGGHGLARIAEKAFGHPLAPRELFDLYRQSDARAVRIVEHCAEVMAIGIGNICWMLDPEIIVLGGSIARNNPELIALIQNYAQTRLPDAAYLKLASARYGDDAGLIGAALMLDERGDGHVC